MMHVCSLTQQSVMPCNEVLQVPSESRRVQHARCIELLAEAEKGVVFLFVSLPCVGKLLPQIGLFFSLGQGVLTVPCFPVLFPNPADIFVQTPA